MGIVSVSSGGVDFNTTGISDVFATTIDNPAAYIVLNNLNYILAIVAGALFALGAFLAFINLIRDKFGVHLLIILFALERVATYVIRALLYKKPKVVYGEVFEILEAAGTAIILIILYHLWSGTSKNRTGKASKGGRCCGCCMVFLATVASLAGAGLFIAGAILQDRQSSTADQFDRGYKLRKVAVIVYGGVLAVFDLLAFFLLCRKGGRRGGFGLLLAGLLLSAKAGFQIYAIWKRVDRYYTTKWFWPFLVLTELVALLIIAMPGAVRSWFKPKSPMLPVTDAQGQYVVGGASPQPYAPSYQGPAIQPVHYK